MTNSDLIKGDLINESELCQACGLCCQGQLYGWVALQPEEIELAKTWPLEMLTNKDKDIIGFKQPCGCFKEGRCSVYLQRPYVCSDYTCQLLKRLRKFEVSQPEAMEHVTQARQLFEEIQRALPENAGKGIWQRVNEQWNLSIFQPLLESGELDSKTLMSIVALDVLLTKYFRNIKNDQSTEDDAKSVVP